ncbi:MAG: twin-arginine translocase TatA/TatE family subunit [Gemmatimonadota bacterium]
MGFGGLGMWEVLLILLVALLVFGAKRLPEIGSSLGKGIREFKSSVREIERELKYEDRQLPPQARAPEAKPPATDATTGGEPRKLTTSG